MSVQASANISLNQKLMFLHQDITFRLNYSIFGHQIQKFLLLSAIDAFMVNWK